MSRHDRHTLSAETQRELDAVDAALNGEAVADAHAPLAELAHALRATRPRPREEFVRALDERAARGFNAGGERVKRSRGGRRRRPPVGVGNALLARPALGLAVVALLAASVAVPLVLSGGARAPVASSPAKVLPVSRAPHKAKEQAQVSAGSSSNGPMVRSPAPAKPAARGAAAPIGAAPGASTRQLEKTATLDVGVAPSAIESTSQRVFTVVTAFNGYVLQSNVSSGDSAQGGASFDVRVPSSNLAGAIAALSHLGHVRSENGTTNDVTDQFESLRRSLAELGAERASLLRQLAAASEAQQAAVLKARIHSIDRRISEQQGVLHALSARVNYTSLALSLTPESSLGAASGDLTPGGAARDAARILNAALAVIVLGAAATFPLGVLLIAAWMIVTVTRRRLREQALNAS
jgi:uncharacterized protein DUF4349